jgi:small subunit ribosomal protein S1
VDAKDRKIGLSMRNVDDPTVPEEIPDMPIEGPEAEKAMETAKAAREKKEGKREDLRGGTGDRGPLFQMPGSDAGEKKE